MELNIALTTPGSQTMREAEPNASWSKSLVGRVAGLVALLSAGALPLDVDAILIHHAASMTPGTTSVLSVKEAVSSEEILRALVKVHDAMVDTSVELNDAARTVLYGQLWNLYE